VCHAGIPSGTSSVFCRSLLMILSLVSMLFFNSNGFVVCSSCLSFSLTSAVTEGEARTLSKGVFASEYFFLYFAPTRNFDS
jgi:hypothetical protein